MNTTAEPRKRFIAIGCAILSCGLLFPHSSRAEDDGDHFRGSVDFLYRSVSIDGSQQRYDDDFDGLTSGGRLHDLLLEWDRVNSSVIDYAQVRLSGLGGDPFERNSIRLGRKDVYDFSLDNRSQKNIYDLFELIGDEDGHTWDTKRELTDLNLTIHAAENVDLLFGFYEGKRTGPSLFMKDIERELFRLETPLDQVQHRYSVGANFRIGKADVVFRQALRRYDNQFENRTEADLGLDLAGPTQLDSYEWLQNDSSSADLTTLKVHTPLGGRVDLTVSYYGTLFGEEELTSNVLLNASGLDFTGPPGAPFALTDAFSNTEMELDLQMIDADVSVMISDPLVFHLQYRSVDQEGKGVQTADLDDDGTVDITSPMYDHTLDTLSGILEYRPIPRLNLRAGYRTIDRELTRDGYGSAHRDEDFESDSDEVLLFGAAWRAADWLKINADYEQGDITRPFTQVSPFETDRTRFRASITPRDDFRIDLQYLDYCNETLFVDSISVNTFTNRSEGNTYSATVWHRPHDRFDYSLRYSLQDQETRTGILFDTAAFGGTEFGTSIFDNENTSISGRLRFGFADAWDGFVRFAVTESDGDDLFLGTTFAGDITTVTGLPPFAPIDQDYTDYEAGVTYTYPSGLYAGGSVRSLDYDDANDLQDYDGEIVTFRMGMKF